MEYISGSTLLSFLNKNFLKSPSSESERDRNNKLFIHIVKEFATIIGVLQTNLRMNHRDIKINNVLIRDKDNPFPTLVLIDYGFACIANGPQDPLSEMSKIEAGSFFGSKYACFKNGRDFAQFLYSLHCHFPLYNYLTGNVLHIVEQWMMIPWEKGIANLMNGLNSVGRPSDIRLNNLIFDEGIYIFLRKPEVDPNHCSPILVLEKIKELCETE